MGFFYVDFFFFSGTASLIYYSKNNFYIVFVEKQVDFTICNKSQFIKHNIKSGRPYDIFDKFIGILFSNNTLLKMKLDILRFSTFENFKPKYLQVFCNLTNSGGSIFNFH